MAEKVPLHPALTGSFGGRALGLALAGGEDYELLFTASRAVMDAVQKAAALPVSVIGEVTADNPGEVTLLDAAGKPVTPPATGWEHFRQA
jgi:thiamine-monophosphate kinase